MKIELAPRCVRLPHMTARLALELMAVECTTASPLSTRSPPETAPTSGVSSALLLGGGGCDHATADTIERQMRSLRKAVLAALSDAGSMTSSTSTSSMPSVTADSSDDDSKPISCSDCWEEDAARGEEKGLMEGDPGRCMEAGTPGALGGGLAAARVIFGSSCSADRRNMEESKTPDLSSR